LQSIAVSPANPSINTSQTQQFTATGTYSDGSTKNITTTATWASSNPSVATVGPTTGLATGVAAGATQVTAMLGTVVSTADTLTVNAIALQSIAVSPTNPSIYSSQSQQFTATGTYSDGSTKNITTTVMWASSNPSSATIGANTGLAAGVAAGSTQITATLGSVVSPAGTLTVNAITLQSISVSPANPSINPSQTQQFTATGAYSDGSLKDITATAIWVSSNAGAATIDSTGLATGVAFGATQITATIGSVVSPADTLTINTITLQSIAVSPANPAINPSQTQQFTATGTYSDGSRKDITISANWASSSPAIATISASTGLASGVAAGFTQITATLGNVTSLADILTVTPAAGGNSYTTNFSLTENPISEGGKWISGKATGLDWSDVRTTPGFAFGTQSDTVPYDDSAAVLTGTWGPDQTAQATVYTVNQDSSVFEEVELRLRTSISAHSISGYEINFRCTSADTQYVQIVRWNGPFDNFTLLDSRGGPGLKTGDVVTATAVGDTISAYINGVLIVQVTDTTFTSGSPGMGFYIQNGSASQESDYGFTSFTASDGGAADSSPPSVPVNLVANVISSSEIDLSWSPSTDNVAVVGYKVFRNNAQIATSPVPSFADLTAVPGILYTYTVAAFDAAGNVSAQSSPVTHKQRSSRI